MMLGLAVDLFLIPKMTLAYNKILALEFIEHPERFIRVDDVMSDPVFLPKEPILEQAE